MEIKDSNNKCIIFNQSKINNFYFFHQMLIIEIEIYNHLRGLRGQK